jgi:hypothetical protein
VAAAAGDVDDDVNAALDRPVGIALDTGGYPGVTFSFDTTPAYEGIGMILERRDAPPSVCEADAGPKSPSSVKLQRSARLEAGVHPFDVRRYREEGQRMRPESSFR